MAGAKSKPLIFFSFGRIGPPPQFLGEGADAGAVVGRGSSVLGGPAFALKDPWSGGVDEDEEERDIFFVDYAACKRRRILAK